MNHQDVPPKPSSPPTAGVPRVTVPDAGPPARGASEPSERVRKPRRGLLNQRTVWKAVFVIVLLIGTIGWTIHRFHGVDRIAAILLVPYLAWVAFASYLNVGILVLNG